MTEIIGEFLDYVLVDLVLVGIFYWPGWLILRTFSFGRYPPARGQAHNKEFVAAVAAVVLISALTIYYSHFMG